MFEKRSSGWPLLLAAGVAVLGLILLARGNQARIEDQMRTDTGNALSTVLQATTGSVQQWFREREQEVAVLAGHHDVRDYARVLAERDVGVETDEMATARAALVAQLDEFALGMGYQGYLVLSREGAVLVSHDPAAVPPGRRDLVREEFLADVISGPRYGAVELPHLLNLRPELRPEPTMLVGSAIREEDGGIMASLVLLVDPQRSFTQILQRGRIGESGESYAFDRNGRLISESRFDDQLRLIGLISDDERAILNIQIRDPGVNLTEGLQSTVPRSDQPLTLMAEQAIATGAGSNLDGYNDYRGVPVVGAWTWDEINGIGIATELDVAEAYRSVGQLRRSALYATLVSILLVLSLTGLFLRNRVRMAEAHSELESVVERFRALTESATDAIISADSDSTIVGWNQAAADMFGWGEQEIIGKPVETIIPDRFRKQHRAGMDRLTTTGESRVIGNTVEVVGLHREGNEFPIELSLSMWSSGPDRYYSGIVRDITERKRMEAELEEARLRMEDELNVGREIQMSMLPLIFPAFPKRAEFSVYAALEPAREVGGDFYDFFLVDEDRFCFCVGDVSGKGVPAALFMAVTKTLLKSRATSDYSPASIMTHVNREISASNESNMFVTIFLGILDVQTGQLLYTNAGHNPPYIRRSNGMLVRLEERHGPVVGAVDSLVYEQGEATLWPGDQVFAYTDGVTEAMDASQQLYEEDRLLELLSFSEAGSIDELVQATVEDVSHFQGEADQADDITVLGVQFFGQPEGETPEVLELTVPGRLPEIDLVNGAFNEFAGSRGVPVAVCRTVNVVFDELLNNIVSYAYEGDGDRHINFRVELTSDRLTATIADDGPPFNPFAGSPPDTTLSLEERDIGGLGVHLVRNVMDEAIYHRRADKNVVIVAKYLARLDSA